MNQISAEEYAQLSPAAKKIARGLNQALEHENGIENGTTTITLERPDPKEAREKLGLSRESFGNLMGVSKHTVEKWEQGKRNPAGSAEILMKIALDKPELVKAYANTS